MSATKRKRLACRITRPGLYLAGLLGALILFCSSPSGASAPAKTCVWGSEQDPALLIGGSTDVASRSHWGNRQAYDKKASGCTLPTKGIALGKDIAGGGLKELAEQTGASRWQYWARDGITRRTVTRRFGRAFHQAVQRANKIHFSLDGIKNPAAAVREGAKGFVQGNFTHAELHYIVNNPKALAKTIFYRLGKVVPSPF